MSYSQSYNQFILIGNLLPSWPSGDLPPISIESITSFKCRNVFPDKTPDFFKLGMNTFPLVSEAGGNK